MKNLILSILLISSVCFGSGGSFLGSGGGGGTPGGISGDIQYNNAGAFGGDPMFYTDGNGTVHAEELGAEFIDVAQLRIDGAGIVTIKMSQGSATTYNFNMPDDAGTAGYLLTSQGGVSTPMTWTNPASFIGTTLTSAHIFVGNSSNVATSVAVSGNVTISNTGVTTIGASQVTNAMLAGSIAFSNLAALSSGNILVGSAGNVATSVAMSGDATIVDSGALSIGAGKVTNTMLAGSIAANNVLNVTNASNHVLTGFSASAGTVASTDTTLGAVQKIVGNQALYLPLAGGTMASNASITFQGSGHLIFPNANGTLFDTTQLQIKQEGGSSDRMGFYTAAANGRFEWYINGFNVLQRSTNEFDVYDSTNSAGIYLQVSAAGTQKIGFVTNLNLGINGNAGTAMGITGVDHIKLNGDGAATAVVNANAGVAATCTIAHTGDMSGIVTLTPNGTPATGAQCAITFHDAYAVAPICFFQPTETNSIGVAIPGATSTTAKVDMVVNVALVALTSYVWNYFCTEPRN